MAEMSDFARMLREKKEQRERKFKNTESDPGKRDIM